MKTPHETLARETWAKIIENGVGSHHQNYQAILAALAAATAEQAKDTERLDWLEGPLGRLYQRSYSNATITRQAIDTAREQEGRNSLTQGNSSAAT